MGRKRHCGRDGKSVADSGPIPRGQDRHIHRRATQRHAQVFRKLGITFEAGAHQVEHDLSPWHRGSDHLVREPRLGGIRQCGYVDPESVERLIGSHMRHGFAARPGTVGIGSQAHRVGVGIDVTASSGVRLLGDRCPLAIEPEDGCRGPGRGVLQNYFIDGTKKDGVRAELMRLGNSTDMGAKGTLQNSGRPFRHRPSRRV